jgi:hypothetical protein
VGGRSGKLQRDADACDLSLLKYADELDDKR